VGVEHEVVDEVTSGSRFGAGKPAGCALPDEIGTQAAEQDHFFI